MLLYQVKFMRMDYVSVETDCSNYHALKGLHTASRIVSLRLHICELLGLEAVRGSFFVLSSMSVWFLLL